jgi:hypothetical protein
MEDPREPDFFFLGRGWSELTYLIPRETIVDKFLRQKFILLVAKPLTPKL